MAERDSLVGRAVEAAAIERFERLFGHELSHERWATCHESWREHQREMVRPAVLAALGVVADHCTTEAHKAWEWASKRAHDLDRGAQYGRVRKAMTLTDMAAECRGDAT